MASGTGAWFLLLGVSRLSSPFSHDSSGTVSRNGEASWNVADAAANRGTGQDLNISVSIGTEQFWGVWLVESSDPCWTPLWALSSNPIPTCTYLLSVRSKRSVQVRARDGAGSRRKGEEYLLRRTDPE